MFHVVLSVLLQQFSPNLQAAAIWPSLRTPTAQACRSLVIRQVPGPILGNLTERGLQAKSNWWALRLVAQSQSGHASDDASAPVILGQPDDQPYVVAIPTTNPALLAEVRRFAPQAFLTRSRRGSYIQAGAFGDRRTAEQLNRQLRQQGFDARVIFLSTNW